MKKIIKTVICIAALISAVSCMNNTKTLLPNVSGKAGEVIIVVGKDNWEGNLGTRKAADLHGAGPVDVGSVTVGKRLRVPAAKGTIIFIGQSFAGSVLGHVQTPQEHSDLQH